MNASATKGFFIGCVTSVLALVLFVFLFVLMCGLLMRGCVEAADSDDAQDVGASLRRKVCAYDIASSSLSALNITWIISEKGG